MMIILHPLFVVHFCLDCTVGSFHMVWHVWYHHPIHTIPSTHHCNTNHSSSSTVMAPSSPPESEVANPHCKRLEDLGYGVESFSTILRPGKYYVYHHGTTIGERDRCYQVA